MMGWDEGVFLGDARRGYDTLGCTTVGWRALMDVYCACMVEARKGRDCNDNISRVFVSCL